MINPLFASDKDGDPGKPPQNEGYVISARSRKGRTIQPLSMNKPSEPFTADAGQTPGSSSAIELIRNKVAALYADEPDARQEIAEVNQPQPTAAQHVSKHQQFMHDLSRSGKSLAQIQTEWHNYYVQLPTEKKHEVWREFYENAKHHSSYGRYAGQTPAAAAQPGLTLPQTNTLPAVPGQGQPPHARAVVARHAAHLPSAPVGSRRAIAHLKRRIVNRVLASNEAQVKAKQHLHSLVFGLGTGLIVLLVLLFSFFNEMVIAPFIQPSRHVSATPIIVDASSVAPSAKPEVIIPKINVQIPVVYDEKSIDEAAVQRALERGVIHYPTTVKPGQKGNAAFFGHSSNNIFNKGQYKFAFVLLHELVPGDIFYLTNGGKIYTYRVFSKKVVAPSQVSVLNNVPGKTATAALITCDPPGTSTNRLVVWGEQISPDPSGATAPSRPSAANTNPQQLPSDGPTMWSRFWNWLL